MSKKYFNKKNAQRAKGNLRRNGGRKKMLSRRMGGVLNASVVMENRNVDAAGLGTEKKESI